MLTKNSVKICNFTLFLEEACFFVLVLVLDLVVIFFLGTFPETDESGFCNIRFRMSGSFERR
jgi:hypothetical protein